MPPNSVSHQFFEIQLEKDLKEGKVKIDHLRMFLQFEKKNELPK